MPSSLPTSPEFTVGIADDHPLIAWGLARFVGSLPGFRPDWVSSNRDETWERLEASPVDLLLVDIEMPGMAILTFLRRVRRTFSSTAVLVVSALPAPIYSHRVIRAGAAGFLSKSAPAEEMQLALQALARGQVWKGVRSPGHRASPGVQALSARELEVFQLLGSGLSPREVGSVLGISHRTVATHRLRIYRKLEIRTLGELIRLANEHMSPRSES